MPTVSCKRRKYEKTCEKDGSCVWKNDKCEYLQTPPKRVVCGLRKEKACKKVTELCDWNGEKCLRKGTTAVPKPKPKPKSPLPLKSKSPSPLKPKSASPLKPKSASPLKPKSASPLKSKSPSPLKPKSPLNLKNKHCLYFEDDAKFNEIVDLAHDSKETYDQRFRSKTNVHIGQRKLILSEIQLLNAYYAKYKTDPTLVYVGAAPGSHLLTLSDMFPKVKFILYDGAKFDVRLKSKPAFQIHDNTFFTTETCKELSDIKDNLLFVSDIRLGEDDRVKFEHGVTRDMEMQQEWVEELKPKMSLLKFRLSYNMKHGEKLKYLAGDLLYGIWPKPLSGETRLLVTDPNKTQLYDFQSYEETLFYHNKQRRATCTTTIPESFKKYIKSNDNIYCSCYDCYSELLVLETYSKLFNKSFDDVVMTFGKQMNWQKKPAFQKARGA